MSNLTPTSQEAPMYALASDLIGFRSPTLRVRVERSEPNYVWVTTADLLDAGTKLVLDPKQVRALPEYEPAGWMHKDGLVALVG